jgi:hypothetical protein
MNPRRVVIALSTLAVLGGCHRHGPDPATLAAPSQLATPRRTTPPPFTHPLFAGRRDEPAAATDCSRAALSRLAQRVRSIERELAPRAHARADRWLQETRDQIIPRAAACVGHDGPLDVPWEMLHSATLSLEICADARHPADERVARCRRALDIAGRAERGG